jgi:hypothetical protein
MNVSNIFLIDLSLRNHRHPGKSAKYWIGLAARRRTLEARKIERQCNGDSTVGYPYPGFRQSNCCAGMRPCNKDMQVASSQRKPAIRAAYCCLPGSASARCCPTVPGAFTHRTFATGAVHRFGLRIRERGRSQSKTEKRKEQDAHALPRRCGGVKVAATQKCRNAGKKIHLERTRLLTLHAGTRAGSGDRNEVFTKTEAGAGRNSRRPVSQCERKSPRRNTESLQSELRTSPIWKIPEAAKIQEPRPRNLRSKRPAY